MPLTLPIIKIHSGLSEVETEAPLYQDATWRMTKDRLEDD